ncbi:type II toxin-antitoxin system CcdA family antitoxin [Sulfitobacter sp. M57]|uniref:type II toxin-antitoxin system CcdA family antitoxin n=1 Tax=unclassified Sulfitobacter TaxID=196795 RepID=UPI0023E0A627|nr:MULTISPECIES: type II toxin-antitoxin system CcdA family antitoxin [unclassified Sulfitobacter]MDF3416024.1 type II toxin-antitoxin system CcdA family antitoxin [Sulfitobacter sp. KE5]MDF3423504.1 type II toxin-antitoxin system CcdA family antitoxin [Sulfitobacter sp. KE43]MDF3434695.1 type II toxin-antitoxin system CcdA family antitoxin [Sulfitobacter sp. KE42]MDF3460210.1 type II toxin-antitoxin system CcdA family antitoxin [Sulfitobacter sp. S74]MDF3464232.1 type II toxin-antitoxin syste
MGIQGSGKKATNLSLDQELLKDAKALGVNISAAAEDGVRHALREAWLEENREALTEWGRWIEENGLPLENHRMFNV